MRTEEPRIYKSLHALYYRTHWPIADKDELEYYKSKVIKNNGPALVGMCGTGRFIVPLRKEGLEICGVDASKYMLDICSNEINSTDSSNILFNQYLEKFRVNKKFSTIFIPATSFGMLSVESKMKKSLENLYKHLMIGGELILDIVLDQKISVNALTTILQDTTDLDKNSQIIFTRESSFEHKKGTVEVIKGTYKLYNKGRLVLTENEVIRDRYFSIQTITDLLAATGFENISITKVFSEKSLNENDSLAMVKCNRYL